MPITLRDNTSGAISIAPGATIRLSSDSGGQRVIGITTGNNKLVGGSGNDIIEASGTSNLLTGNIFKLLIFNASKFD